MTGKKWLLCTFFQMVADRKPKPLNTPGCVFVKKKKHLQTQKATRRIFHHYKERTKDESTWDRGVWLPCSVAGWLAVFVDSVCLRSTVELHFSSAQKRKNFGRSKTTVNIKVQFGRTTDPGASFLFDCLHFGAFFLSIPFIAFFSIIQKWKTNRI